jgi:hypothetical protein
VLTAEKLRKTNIAEYIIYMWQIEDIIRACSLNIDIINRNIIENSPGDNQTQSKIRQWYSDLIQMMILEKVENAGHLQILKNRVIDMNDLHLRLLKMPSESKYRRLYNTAYPFLRGLEQKSTRKDLSEIELCLNGLYGVYVLKIRKMTVADATLNAVKSFSAVLAYLAKKYIEFEKNPEPFL